jgi:hypothetical protein
VGHQCSHNKTALYRRVYLAGPPAPSGSLQAGIAWGIQHEALAREGLQATVYAPHRLPPPLCPKSSSNCSSLSVISSCSLALSSTETARR